MYSPFFSYKYRRIYDSTAGIEINDRTIILSEDDVIDVEIGRFKQDEEQEVDASFDGRHPVNLNEGDKIRIIRSDKATKIMKLSKVSFLDTLQKKMRVV